MGASETTNESNKLVDEPEWIPIKEAAKLSGQPIRRIRFWKDDHKIRSKTFEDRPNAPVFVVLEEVEALAEQREATEKLPETLPVPVAVFEQLKNLQDRLIDAESARAKAETTNDFLRERIRELELRKAKDSMEAEISAPTKKWWHW